MASKIFFIFIIGLLLQSHALAQTKLSNLVDTVQMNGNLKTVYQAILNSGFVLTLAGGRGPYTIFAPTDDAFAALSAETLQYIFKPENQQVLADIFAYHLYGGNLTVNTIKSFSLPTDLRSYVGKTARISEDKNGQIRVNDAAVVKGDIFASNGVIHTIDKVLLAPITDLSNAVAQNPNFQILFKALQAADLTLTLKSRGPFTIFAPTDYAFQKLPAGTLDNLLKPENRVLLTQILTYHVVDGQLTSADLEAMKTPSTIISFNRKPLRFAEYGKNLFINNATVVIRDILASNGIIHAIDEVLLPSGL